MVREIYGREPNDPKYDSTALETDSDLEALLTKLRILMLTTKGEVFGEPELGINLEDMLFTFALNESQLEGMIREQIAQYIPEATKYNLQIKIEFYKKEVRDECLIDFIIDDQKYLGIYAR